MDYSETDDEDENIDSQNNNNNNENSVYSENDINTSNANPSPSTETQLNENAKGNEVEITNDLEPIQTEKPTLDINLTENRANCNTNNGGCDQICSYIQDEPTGNAYVECSCNEGFYLDSIDGKKCIGKYLF